MAPLGLLISPGPGRLLEPKLKPVERAAKRMTGAVTFQPRVQRARVPEMGSKYARSTLSPDLAEPVPPARTPPLRTVSPSTEPH